MKTFTTHKAVASVIMVLIFFVSFGCSGLLGGSRVSDDPAVAAQQQQVEQLQRELKEAEQYAEEARQREKAAKNRLKAAEHELKALEERSKRRSNY